MRRALIFVAAASALAGCGSTGNPDVPGGGARFEGESVAAYVERIRKFCRGEETAAREVGAEDPAQHYAVCFRSSVAEAIQRGYLPSGYRP